MLQILKTKGFLGLIRFFLTIIKHILKYLFLLQNEIINQYLVHSHSGYGKYIFLPS